MSKKNSDKFKFSENEEILFDLSADPFFDADASIDPRPKYSKIPANIIRKRAPRKIKVDRNIQIDARLDLHGETLVSSQRRLDSFIRSSIHRNDKVLLIITGKGLNSGEQGGVLKKSTWDWLNDNASMIKEFRTAPGFLGGDGAILLFL
ncbi:MAG: Smr/MutS family protein [Proteobacteria bacterium]|nr:Smr/MutS family protein [Pseudomonadota bacterium]